MLSDEGAQDMYIYVRPHEIKRKDYYMKMKERTVPRRHLRCVHSNKKWNGEEERGNRDVRDTYRMCSPERNKYYSIMWGEEVSSHQGG